MHMIYNIYGEMFLRKFSCPHAIPFVTDSMGDIITQIVTEGGYQPYGGTSVIQI